MDIHVAGKSLFFKELGSWLVSFSMIPFREFEATDDNFPYEFIVFGTMDCQFPTRASAVSVLAVASLPAVCAARASQG